MKFNIQENLRACIQSPIIGNVYNVRGGTGAKHGYMMVIVAITNHMVTVLTLNKEGEIVGGSNFGVHYFEEKCPIAFCPSMETLTFDIQNIA